MSVSNPLLQFCSLQWCIWLIWLRFVIPSSKAWSSYREVQEVFKLISAFMPFLVDFDVQINWVAIYVTGITVPSKVFLSKFLGLKLMQPAIKWMKNSELSHWFNRFWFRIVPQICQSYLGNKHFIHRVGTILSSIWISLDFKGIWKYSARFLLVRSFFVSRGFKNFFIEPLITSELYFLSDRFSSLF